MILFWAVIIGLLSVGFVVAAHGFTYVVQQSVPDAWAPDRS